ncbi:MAG: DUF2817 domain-containing protein [Actinobacteria bacterium]|nr:DUF2817 domain-containing protein [Actinomycetota bacterium]
MTAMIDPFVPYAEQRRRFLAAAEASGALLSHRDHPLRGVADEALATDVARFGAPIGEADRVLVVQSGTHGVEGHAGSALQRRLLASGRLDSLAPGIAVVLVHAVNPWGMSWTRRVNEDNIDVNRNFVPFPDAPANDQYAAVDHLINPTGPDFDPNDTSYLEGVLAFWAEVGDHRAMQVLSGGQYTHPAGVQFGGQDVSWSRRTVESIWAEQLDGSSTAVILDIHTGLGPEGRLTVFQTADSDTAAAVTGARWYPDYIYRSDRSEPDPVDRGLLGPGFDDWAVAAGPSAPAETATFVIEFGTLDVMSGLSAFRADNWLHHHGDRSSEVGKAIVEQMRHHFFLDDESWRAAVAEQGDMSMHVALDGLADL